MSEMRLALKSKVVNNGRIERYLFLGDNNVLVPVDRANLKTWLKTEKPVLTNCRPNGSGLTVFGRSRVREVHSGEIIPVKLTLEEPKVRGIDYTYALIPFQQLFLGPIPRWIVAQIDEATIDMIGDRTIYFKTPFGVARHDELSSGCKAALVVNHMLRTQQEGIIPLLSAGGNAEICVWRLLQLYHQAGFKSKLRYYSDIWYANVHNPCFIFDCDGSIAPDPTSAVVKQWERLGEL